VLTPLAATLASSPPPNLPGFLNVVAPYLEHYSYWAVLLLVMLEDFGIPVPGETILIAAAIFAGAGRLNVVLVGLVGFVAAVIGDNIGFAIGHFGGRALALRWGKYVFLTQERLAKAEYFFDHHGARIIVVARFIEGLRQANGIIAGISGMHWRRFVVFNALGAALWVGTWVTLENLTLSGGADLPEDPEAIEVHGAQEAQVIQGTAGVQEDTGTGEATETEEGAGIKNGSGTTGRPGIQTGAGTQNGAGTQESAETQNGAGTQESAETQNGAGTQESAETQSS